MSEQTVVVTAPAARRIAEIVAAEPAGTMLRVAVEGGGCSGFQYRYDLTREMAADDIVIERDGAKVLIDPVSLEYLSGSEIDFVDDLIGASFQIRNPHATSSCGCGTSFSLQHLDKAEPAPFMKVVTWNINGVKARLEIALTYLREAKPDVIGLQEIKSVDEGFPREAFEELGYRVETFGQKGFNGVAILSRIPIEDVTRGLPGGDGDEQSRYIEATIIEGGLAIRFASLYLPNGNPIGTEKFSYKLAWMERLEAHARALLKSEMPVVLAGDYNVIPEPVDAKRPAAWTNDALFQPESRAMLRRIEALGFTDSIRACQPGPGVYTFWDYQAGAWNKDDGIRIDHILLSPQAADLLVSAGVDKHTRGWEKPSDHAPVWVELG